MDKSGRGPTYDIERYLNIRGAGSPSMGPDGEIISFLMDTTGVGQVWSLTEPGGWPTQRTFYEERVTFVSWSPERPELIFGKDEGGNEREQFFRLSAGGTVTPLTKTPSAKHWWGGWNSDGSEFAFTSNRRDEAVFDVYVQDRDAQGDAARLVHEGDGWISVAGWSPDDTRLLVHEAHSNYDMDVYVLDIATGELEHITPHSGDVRYGSVEWGPTGEAVYLTTDEGTDTMFLGRLDLGPLAIEPVEQGGEWNIDGVVIDEDTERIAYSRNVDGYSELNIGVFTDEVTIEQLAGLDLPDGVYSGFDFGPDAERLVVAVTSDTQNANVWVVQVETGAATRWTRASTAGIPESSFVESTIVHYRTFDDREIPAFFSLPANPGDAVPVIVDIHGGPESQRRPSFSAVKQYFLDAGYGVFEPNVRGSTGYGKAFTRLDDKRKRMDAVRDIKAGIEWLHEQSTVSPDRIVALGGSYGGFMVLAALTEYPEL